MSGSNIGRISLIRSVNRALLIVWLSMERFQGYPCKRRRWEFLEQGFVCAIWKRASFGDRSHLWATFGCMKTIQILQSSIAKWDWPNAGYRLSGRSLLDSESWSAVHSLVKTSLGLVELYSILTVYTQDILLLQTWRVTQSVGLTTIILKPANVGSTNAMVAFPVRRFDASTLMHGEESRYY